MSNVKIIGQRAFDQNTQLKEVDLPATLQKIGRAAFSGTSLVKVTCRATTPPAVDSSFGGIRTAQNLVLYVPASSIQAYKTVWSGELTSNFRGLQNNGYTPFPIP